jgi:localization factor PodJL
MIKAFPWKSGDSSKSVQGQPPAPGNQPVLPDETAGRVYGAELNRVEAKLNSLLAAVTAAAEAQPVNWTTPASAPRRPSLGTTISEISRRQQELDALRAPPPRDPFMVTVDPQPYEARARATSLVTLQNDIAGLSAKLDNMQREQAARYAAPPVCNLDRLRGEIAAMSEALRDVASRGSVATVESAIRGLSQKIEESRNGGTKDAILRPMEELVAELRQSLAEIDPRMTIKGLESEVSKLGVKIDDLGRAGVDPATFGHIQAQTREIRDLLSAAIARPLPVERIERQVAELAQSLGEQRAIPRENFANVRGPAPEQFSAIEARLEQIAAKVEESLNATRDQSRYDDLSHRIDNVHEGLTARIADVQRAAPDTSALEELVRSLSDKIERAVAPQADHRAIEALEEQISLLAQRMETSNPALSLNALERAIGELFGEFERTRTASLDAAEQSARNAVREAMSGIPDQAADRAKLAGELGELRDRQEQADQRTLSTLNAVHETLEKVVERLSTFETELTERRGPPNDFPPPPPYKPPPASPPPPPFVERHDTRPPEPPFGATEDFLIEPGSGYRGRRDNGNSNALPPALPDAPETSTRSDFIAAARRAAQAAQRETAAASVLSQVRPGPAPIGESKAGLLQGTRTIIAQYRRPVVLSLAAIFVAISAYAVLKSLGHPPTKISSLDPPAAVASANPPSASFTAPQAPVVAMGAPAKADDSVLSPNSIVTPPPAPPSMTGVDPMATGSIGHPPAFRPSGPRDISLADLRSQARDGSALAQFALGVSYTDGRVLPRDLKTASQWYEKAASQGFAPAQYRLASFYEKGLGVARDTNKAQALYQKAAVQGNIRAMHNLAVLAADGGDSGRPDYATAAHWFKQAADYGVRDSQYNYAVLLARGMGVQQDFVASYVWFAVAAKQGDQDSASKRDDVGARLSAAQLASAKAMADAFRPRTPSASANDVVMPVISASPRPSSSEAPLSFGQRPKVSML